VFVAALIALMLFVRLLIVPEMQEWGAETWHPLMRRGVQGVIALVIIALSLLIFYKWISDGHAALIHALWRSKPHKRDFGPFLALPFVERADMHDLREKTTEFRCICVTRGLIPITVRVRVRWHPDTHQLVKFVSMKIEPMHSLDNLITKFLTREVSRRSPSQVVEDSAVLSQGLFRTIAVHIDGAMQFCIHVNAVSIAGIDVPVTIQGQPFVNPPASGPSASGLSASGLSASGLSASDQPSDRPSERPLEWPPPDWPPAVQSLVYQPLFGDPQSKR
jgi:regulator of protease activity HflC (stomatin/prohibitin superfamily)